jgi:hypothetical protein
VAGPLLGAGARRLDDAALRALRDRTAAAGGDLVALAVRTRAQPGDLALGRMAAQLVAVLARLEADDAGPAFALLRTVAGPLLAGGGERLDGPALRAMLDRAAQAGSDLFALSVRARAEPGDLALGRMAAQLVGVLARLGATADWAAIGHGA